MQLVSDADHLKASRSSTITGSIELALYLRLRFTIVAIFLGLGSTVFNYLFLKSGYIPRILAAWGIFSSLLYWRVNLQLSFSRNWKKQ